MNALKRRWKLVPLAALAVGRRRGRRGGDGDRSRQRDARSRSRSCPTVRARSGRSTTRTSPASSTAMSQFAGAKAKNPNKPRDGWTGGSINGHPLKLVGVGCSNDRADTAIKETKRLMEQLGADIMIGPLSGDESIAVANYAKQHPTKTFVDGSAGAQDTTLKVRAPNFFRFNGDGAQWNAGLGDLAYNKLRLEDGGGRRGRLLVRVDVGGRLHRRVLRGRRQRHEAGVPAAQHDGLLVVRPADADRTSTAPSSRSAVPG